MCGCGCSGADAPCRGKKAAASESAWVSTRSLRVRRVQGPRTSTSLPAGTAGLDALRPWLRVQAVNVRRHAAALRPFRRVEFGNGPAAPTEGHLQAANRLITSLRRGLIQMTDTVVEQASAAGETPTSARLIETMRSKDGAHNWVQAIERIWDFYFELFGQRQSRYGDWLLSCDRIALDCFQRAFTGIGVAKSIPAPPPFSYMRTGFSPATFRRSIPLRRLGQRLNPFPLIQLPYHRLVNPWTLGAILHEVSHNLQNDLGLARTIPRAIGQAILAAGHPRAVARTWMWWNRELFADVSGLLLGGPAVVASLFDVVGRKPSNVLTFTPRAPHPTPYLRTLISIELLRRMGFQTEARRFGDMWRRLYPDPRRGNIPAVLHETMDAVNPLVVDVVCFRRYAELGNRSLHETMAFGPKDQQMIEECARRLASGTDPGIVPARFLIGAARLALDRRLARPDVITNNFYKELSRR